MAPGKSEKSAAKNWRRNGGGGGIKIMAKHLISGGGGIDNVRLSPRVWRVTA